MRLKPDSNIFSIIIGDSLIDTKTERGIKNSVSRPEDQINYIGYRILFRQNITHLLLTNSGNFWSIARFN